MDRGYIAIHIHTYIQALKCMCTESCTVSYHVGEAWIATYVSHIDQSLIAFAVMLYNGHDM